MEKQAEVKNKSLSKSIFLWGRKKLIGLKRNFYVIPLLFIVVAFCQFMFNLFKISPTATMIFANINDFIINPQNYPTLDISKFGLETSLVSYYSLFIFLITLSSILYVVSFIFFMQNKDLPKKKWFFFGLFFALTTLIIFLEIILVKITSLSLDINNVLLEGGRNIKKVQEAIRTQKENNVIFIANIILIAISMVAVALSPYLQVLIRKVKFSRIDQNGK